MFAAVSHSHPSLIFVSRGQFYKNIFVRNLQMFAHGKFFQPSLMFFGKAKAYLKGAPFGHSAHW